MEGCFLSVCSTYMKKETQWDYESSPSMELNWREPSWCIL